MSKIENSSDNNIANKKEKKARKSKKEKVKRSFGGKVLHVIKILFIIGIVCGILASAGTFLYVKSVLKDLEPIDPSRINETLGENSIVLDANGKELETIENEGLRTIIKYEDISPNLINAYVSVEDKTFWDHNGFNFVRLAGSVYQGITTGDRIKGTSTLTQQLARNIYLAEIKSQRSIERKIKEAYYAIELEKYLTKEQIIESYLNTIYLGSNSYGVQAASRTYFNKEAKDLTLIESAILAGIPASPSNYAPLRSRKKVDVKEDDIIIDDRDELYTVVFNKSCESRYKTVIYLMHTNGYITDSEYEEAKSINIVDYLSPGRAESVDITSYFTDMVKSAVIRDLKEQYGYSNEEATNMLSSKGLRINSTIDYDMQKILEDTYAHNESSMPKVRVTFNNYGNIVNENGTILLYKKENIINSNEEYIIYNNDYFKNDNGDIVLKRGKQLNFYSHYQDDVLVSIQVVSKSIYKSTDLDENMRNRKGGTYNISNLRSYLGRDLLIPNKYKSFDDDRNLVVSKDLLVDDPTFFKFDDAGNILLSYDKYKIDNQGIVQPQSAAVIVDQHNGHLKAIVGGRNIYGQKIFNRAINPRQPGSSIKPISVYLPAIDTQKYTAATPVDDVPVYLKGDNVRWPRNWYEESSVYKKYRGLQTIRQALESSINVIATLVGQDLGVDVMSEYLEKLGVTSIVYGGPVNDMNIAALSLGGMTKGISPLEMAQAYSAVANEGLLNEVITYTTVTDSKGNVLLSNESEQSYVVEPTSAFIVQDMMRSGATTGLSRSAAIREGNSGIPVAGKTGTTSNKIDAWFVGYTPYYTASIWFGNDLNMPLDQGSSVSAKFWSKVMKSIHKDLPNKSFVQPSGLVQAEVDKTSGKLPSELSFLDYRQTVYTEYFIHGTEPTEYDDVHVTAQICTDSEKFATPNCPETSIVTRVLMKRKNPYYPEQNLDDDGNPILLQDAPYSLPNSSCDIHSEFGTKKILSNLNGTYTVLSPFTVKLIDGTLKAIPVKSIINNDLSINLPDGTKISVIDMDELPDVVSLSSFAPVGDPTEVEPVIEEIPVIDEVDTTN